MRGSNAKPLEVRLISHPSCRASPKAEDSWRIPDCASYAIAIAIIVEHAATMHRVDHPNPRHDPNAWAHLLADSEADASAAGPTTPTALFPSLVPARGRRWIAREPLVRTLIANYFTATEPNELHEIVGVPPGPARCRRGERGCGPGGRASRRRARRHRAGPNTAILRRPFSSMGHLPYSPSADSDFMTGRVVTVDGGGLSPIPAAAQFRGRLNPSRIWSTSCPDRWQTTAGRFWSTPTVRRCISRWPATYP